MSATFPQHSKYARSVRAVGSPAKISLVHLAIVDTDGNQRRDAKRVLSAALKCREIIETAGMSNACAPPGMPTRDTQLPVLPLAGLWPAIAGCRYRKEASSAAL